MSNIGLAKSYTAGGTIPAYTIVKLSAAETVVAAAAASDAVLGVSEDIPSVSGERVDVTLTGISFVVAGAAVALGALVMSDASGRAITATAAAGTNVRTIGMALEAASAAGDVIRVLLQQGSFQG